MILTVILLSVATLVIIITTGFIVLRSPSPIDAIEKYYRERDENEFWLMVGCVYKEYPEADRDELVKKYVGWSNRRWDRFTKTFRKQLVLDEFIPDIEMLRALK